MKFWASKIAPENLTLFGGEPLLHPQFAEWAVAVRDIWGPDVGISVNTNGFYLPKLFDKIEILFGEHVRLNVLATVHNQEFDEIISSHYATLQTLVQECFNPTDFANSRWHGIIVEDKKTWIKATFPRYDLLFSMTKQYGIGWCQYIDSTNLIQPHYSYNDVWADANHLHCNVKNYITLYEGKLYKCPPSAIIEHSIKALPHAGWDEYLANYKKLTVDSSDEDIQNWLVRQKGPENICNMCAFAGPKNVAKSFPRSHKHKDGWKIKT